MTQASRRICIGKGAGQPPASVAGPKDGATSRLQWVWQEPSAMRLEVRPSVRQQAPSTLQSRVQTSSCPSLAADAAHQRRDKAASSCSQNLLQELHRLAATKDVTPIIDKSPERRSGSRKTMRQCVCILFPRTSPSSNLHCRCPRQSAAHPRRASAPSRPPECGAAPARASERISAQP